MLPSKNRLKGALSFNKVKAKGKMYQSENFGLLVHDKNDKKPSRFGIVVSSKISKKAVERNKIKRMFRDAIKSNLEKVKDGKDAIVLVKKSTLSLTASKVDKEISKTFKKAGLV